LLKGPRGLQDGLSAVTIAPDISCRNSRVAAFPKRWDRLRAGLDLILDQREADMADLPSPDTTSPPGWRGFERACQMEDIWDYMEAVAANLWLASLYTVTVPGPM
jgi:hypothetical protein